MHTGHKIVLQNLILYDHSEQMLTKLKYHTFANHQADETCITP